MRAGATGSLPGVLLVALALGGGAPAAPTGSGHHIASVAGVKTVDGRGVRLDILIDVPAGVDPAAAGREALAIERARPVRDDPTADFALSGYRWRQFFDRKVSNDFVLQHYNPSGDPTLGGAEGGLRSGEQEWTDVPTATFALEFAGASTAGAAYDGLNVVSWPEEWTHSGRSLAVTLTTYELATGFILDSDVVMNRNFNWFSDPADVAPGRVDARRVLLHENGHVAGLDHSFDRTAVMYPDFSSGIVGSGLAQDDVDAISTLYPLEFVPLPPEHPEHPVTPEPHRPPPVGELARLGGPAPGGGWYAFDFEPYSLNERGQLAFAADLFDAETFESGEGAFLASAAETTLPMARTGGAAPGGGILGLGVWVNIGLNDVGDSVFSFALQPLTLPGGLNSGLYRYSQRTNELTPLVVPNVTPSPTGGTFRGAYRHAEINNPGTVVFSGIVETSRGISGGLGTGVFRADRNKAIAPVVVPGDRAPGGGTFDFADVPSVNTAGDVAFRAHVRGEECVTRASQSVEIHCDGNLYLRRASGEIASIVHQGAPAPGGGTFRSAFDPVLNNRGDILFLGDLTPPPGRLRDVGVFLYSGGLVQAVARPGWELPGGGAFVTAAFQYGNWDLNDAGEIAFSALLDSDTLGLGINDTGLYVRRQGKLELVARTGTVLPGIGTVLKLAPPEFWGFPFSGAALNNKGQVAFQVTLDDFSTGVLLKASVR